MESKKAKITDLHLQEAKKLRLLWDKKKPTTQAVFGETYDIGNQAAVGNFLAGRSALSLKAAAGFARGLGCAIGDFSPRLAAMAAALTGQHSYDAASDIQDRTLTKNITIDQYETGGSMGEGLELRDQPGVIQSWSVSKEWLSKNVRAHSADRNLCIVTGFGDSMQPLFNPGDPLLVDIGVKTVDFDSIYFFRVGSDGYVKRLQRIPTEKGLVIRAKSENQSAYDSFDISESMDFEVLGRVLKIWCSKDF